ncbi:MAG: glycoside hydrolase family 13 protein [Cellulomonadaceae bacterium]|jgi:alpha-glucosidase|nr:glycoside hydrolase family 13 protein [Cellulomonadaceae bacterium]
MTTAIPAVAPDVIHAPSQQTQWWRTAVIYQVYPRSFADSDGDGYGDIPGITSRLDHLVDLGVDALWLSPFYRSPQRDGGYDVTDYRAIDPLFGSLDDADTLITAAHARGLRVIVDLVPNHTSSDHAWFQAALAAPAGSPERDLYMFRDGRGDDGGQPPNNWDSVLGSSAWTRIMEADGKPGQWYLHLFDESQPDLNWKHPQVRAEMEDILRFWLRRGVDGFRVDVAHGLIKQDGLPDWGGRVEMVGGADGNVGGDDAPSVADGRQDGDDAPSGSEIGNLPSDTIPALPVLDIDAPAAHPNPMFDQEEVHDIYRAWRRVLDEFDPPGEQVTRAMVAEAWVEPESRLARYQRADEMQQAFNFGFLVTTWDAAAYRQVITESLAACDLVGAPATWVLSNHDVVRHPSRFGLPTPGARPNGIYAHDPQPDEALGLRRGRAATLFMLALPGSAYLYNGEELGLPEHTFLPDDVRQAPEFFRTGGAEAGRDGCRVPLVWEAERPGFGFSPTGVTWLPQPAAWACYAADRQRGVEGSTLEMYKSALRLRRQYGLGGGGLRWLSGYPIQVLHFEVFDASGTAVTVLANLGGESVALPDGYDVLLASGSLPDGGGLPADTTVWLRCGH